MRDLSFEERTEIQVRRAARARREGQDELTAPALRPA
jgi:hypothetical protein